MIEQFQQALKEATWNPKLIEKYEDIEGELPLLDDVYIPSNTHLGQRKLLLNEISFYNKIDRGTIIYSGSASGEHTPLLLNMYPRLNFLFIDPNFHIMDYDYHYLYKNKAQNLQDIMSLVKNKVSNPRINYLKGLIKKLEAKFCASDGKKYNVLNESIFGREDFIKIKKLDFTKSRVLVIQDFMSGELADIIKAKLDGPIYHISDIRTSNNDSGILYDNALQIVIQHHLGCLSHIKFVLPKYINQKLDVQDWHMPVFEEAKSLGFDFVREYKDNLIHFDKNMSIPYTYLDGEIYLQPWARPLSGETRLWTYGGVKIYDCMEWKRKFNYHNFYRACVYKSIVNRPPGYDGCSDCVLEIHILKEYLKTHPGTYETLRHEVDNVTFHGLRRHLMCVNGGPVTVEYIDGKNNKYTFVKN